MRATTVFARLALTVAVCFAASLVAPLLLAQEYSAPAATLEGGFTYQGRLLDGGVPVNGVCDLRFGLFATAGDGAPIAGPVDRPAVTIGNGLFTVNLDFGPGVFDGGARWLEIALRCPAGAGDFATLAPRQRLLPTPYAYYADAAPWAGLVGKPAWADEGLKAGVGLTLSGATFAVDPALVQLRVAGSCPAGEAVATIHQDGTVTCVAVSVGPKGDKGDPGEPGPAGAGFRTDCATNEIVRWDGAAWVCAGESDPAAWRVGGNAGTDPATHFLGVTDTPTLTLRVSDTVGLRLVYGQGFGDDGVVTPNFIAGDASNHIPRTVEGSTIGGGSGNTADQHYATVGGGMGNLANSTYSVVGGGDYNEATGYAAVVAGGTENRATITNAVVGGGFRNQATNAFATVAGGSHNISTFLYSSVGGGIQNLASAHSATVSGGYSNTVSAEGGMVGGGRENRSTAQFATVSGGRQNLATGQFATVPGGNSAAASRYGQVAQASGGFGVVGDAQRSQYVLRGVTTGSVVELGLDGTTGHRLTVAVDQAIMATIQVVARNEDGAMHGSFWYCVLSNEAGATTGKCNTAWVEDPGPLVQVDVLHSDANDALIITAEGGSVGAPVRVVATVTTTEVSYP